MTSSEDDSDIIRIDLTVRSTRANDFGLYRIYKKLPTIDPDEETDVDALADSPGFLPAAGYDERPPTVVFGKTATCLPSPASPTPFYEPYANSSIFRLMEYHHDASSKTITGLQTLVDNVIMHPDFEQDHFAGFNAAAEIHRLDDYISAQDHTASSSSLPWSAASGWHVGSIRIPVPCTRHKCPENEAPVYEVPNFWYRKIVEVVKEAFQGEQSLDYHLRAHKMLWVRRENELPMRCWGEAYTSNRALEMDAELEELDREPGCVLDRCAAWIMLFSDSTHLTNFGNASMWPIYLSLGNLSKYTRGKPSTFSQHHLAYIPTIPDSFNDWYRDQYGIKPPNYIHTYMKRELMQRLWDILLDDDLVAAHQHGVVTTCGDTILRRTYPRFFAYSTDYLEKYVDVDFHNLSYVVDNPAL
ncbi:hypothetical protein BD626DRAFT_553386 [Schizophyllum amplum]|uniref:Uncharacterized protein n=1 Tax=Schizophyllum amplum TaxID=97359 RepID=A0A550BRL8_9AGAR|nr:hypothetical protein BD626DRAFT_553386 [Auriculariopsis ampla]